MCERERERKGREEEKKGEKDRMGGRESGRGRVVLKICVLFACRNGPRNPSLRYN